MTHPYRVLLILVLLMPLYGYSQYCTSDNRFTEAEYFMDTQLSLDIGVVYATNVLDWAGNPQNLAMDFYYPDTTVDALTQRPFILLIHGGGFRNGSKAGLARHCRAFAKRGFVAASLQYRLGFDTTVAIDPIFAIYRAHQDAHAAMRYIVEHADDYQIDTEWMFMGGQSAGSVTSLNMVYVSQQEWDATIPTIGIQLGPLNTSGNSLTHAFSHKGIFNNWGNTFGSAIQASELLPMVSFHGVLDNTTPINSASLGRVGSGVIHNLLQTNGLCSELTVDSLGGHGIYKSGTGIDFRVKRASCFFKSLFCDNCSSGYLTDSIPANCSSVTSINELTDELDSFSLFPNPAQNTLTIKGRLDHCAIEILHISGAMVREVIFFGNSYSEDVSDLPNGIYMLTVKHLGTNHVEYFKFIKQ